VPEWGAILLLTPIHFDSSSQTNKDPVKFAALERRRDAHLVDHGDIRFWHKADMLSDAMNVCFPGKSGHPNGVLYEYTT
jgi:hypothetical protein